jgi:hypothetical protein
LYRVWSTEDTLEEQQLVDTIAELLKLEPVTTRPGLLPAFGMAVVKTTSVGRRHVGETHHCYFYQGGTYYASWRHSTPDGGWLGVGNTSKGDWRQVDWFPGIKFTATVSYLFWNKTLVENLEMKPNQVLELNGSLFNPGYEVLDRPR